MIRLLVVPLLVVLGSLAVPAASQAEPVHQACLAVQNHAQSEQVRNSELNLLVAGMRQQGQSRQAIEALLSDQLGLRRVSSSPTPVAPLATSPSNINIHRPEIYYERCTGRYTVFAEWNFTSMSALRSEATWCNNPCALGGADGFGVALSRGVSAGGHSLTTWGQTSYYPPRDNRASARRVNSYGASYTGQDKFCTSGCSEGTEDYSFYNGQLVFSIANPGCGSLQAWSKYAHGWRNTAVTDFEVGAAKLRPIFSSDNNKWDKISQPSNTVVPC